VARRPNGFQLSHSEARVHTGVLARALGVSAASVTEMLGKLAGQGLVLHDRYQGAALTPAGRKVAIEMVRHHRLLELYLTRALGYPWDEVHDEAERLEHVISERLEAALFKALDRPTLDPHGHPIPSAEGEMVDAKARSLTECHQGEQLTVCRVSDREPDKLRAIAELGMRLGVSLEVLEESVYEGPVVIRLRGKRVQIPLGLARVIFVQ
jgi:DtxR family transcriptional regulator, Mn-dependent transcriptional regulator